MTTFKRNLMECKNPRWFDGQRDRIICDARWREVEGIHPFIASADDCEAHGRDLFTRLLAGEFGEIDDYLVSPVNIGEIWARWNAAGEKPLPDGTIGWRMWLADENGLHTLGNQTLWKPGQTITAVDNLADVARDDTPDGIYSFKTMMRALSLAEKMQARFSGRFVGVVGSVILSGQVLEHEHGFRATRANLRSLDLALGGSPELIERLRTMYGVPGAPEFEEKRDGDSANKVVFVLGPYRSGTSLIARALQHTMGIDFGDRRTLPGDPSHQPNGYFEDLDLLALDIGMTQELGGHWFDQTHLPNPDLAFRLANEGFGDRAASLIQEKRKGRTVLGMKDFRATALLPFWSEVLAKSGAEAAYVIALRHPANAVASAQAFDWTGMKGPLARQWVRHMLSALSYTGGSRVCLVDYDALVEHRWEGEKIATALGLSLTEAPVEAVATGTSRHYKFASWSAFSQTPEPKLAVEIYEALKGQIEIGPEIMAALPAWERRYEAGEA